MGAAGASPVGATEAISVGAAGEDSEASESNSLLRRSPISTIMRAILSNCHSYGHALETAQDYIKSQTEKGVKRANLGHGWSLQELRMFLNLFRGTFGSLKVPQGHLSAKPQEETSFVYEFLGLPKGDLKGLSQYRLLVTSHLSGSHLSSPPAHSTPKTSKTPGGTSSHELGPHSHEHKPTCPLQHLDPPGHPARAGPGGHIPLQLVQIPRL